MKNDPQQKYLCQSRFLDNRMIKDQRLSLSVLVLLCWFCTKALAASADVIPQGKGQVNAIQDKKWQHGAANCQGNTDPAIEVFQYDPSSYVLRQNKCMTYEAPFIYVLFGDEKVLVLDTGATESAEDFPLYNTVKSLIEKQAAQGGRSDREIVVLHTHGHKDHYTGDLQFQGQANVTVVAPSADGIAGYFNFNAWPEGFAYVDLGGRKLTVIPTPGHQEEAITLYDPHTQWLLSGDTLYPGAIFVKHWHNYQQSIARLALFAEQNKVSLVLGSHIEMTNKPGEYYPIGTTYQPDEASLALTVEDLNNLNTALTQSDSPENLVLDSLVVEPMGMLQKTISNIARWITQ